MRRSREWSSTAGSSEAWAKLRVWASVAGRGRLLLSGSVAHASLKTTLLLFYGFSVTILNIINRDISNKG